MKITLGKFNEKIKENVWDWFDADTSVIMINGKEISDVDVEIDYDNKTINLITKHN